MNLRCDDRGGPVRKCTVNGSETKVDFTTRGVSLSHTSTSHVYILYATHIKRSKIVCHISTLLWLMSNSEESYFDIVFIYVK